MNLKLLAFLMAFLFLAPLVKAQDTTLVKILAAPDDTIKFKKLSAYAWKLMETDKQQSLKLYEELIRISRKQGSDFWVADGWFSLGVINANNANDALAIQKFKAAIPHYKKTNRIKDVAACLLNIGTCSERIGDINTKITSTMQAIILLEKINYQPMLGQAYNGLGVMYYNLNKFSKGRAYFSKALQVAKTANDTTKIIQSLFGMSNCLSSEKEYTSAFKYSREALLLANAFGKHYELAVANNSMAEIYIKEKNGKELIKYTKEVLKHADAIGDTHYRLISFMNFADGYGFINNQHKRIYYLNKALEIGQKNGITIQLDDIYKGLSEANAKLNQPEKAFDYYQKYIVFRDSANNVENNKTVAELEIKYQTAQKEKALSQNQLQLAQKDLQLQKVWKYTIFSIATALVAFLVTSLIYLNFRHKRKLHTRQLQTVQQEKEIQVLQALMQGEEKERTRIAKDLHDGVAGMLAATKLHVSTLSLQNGELENSKSYLQAINLLDEASREVRKTAHNLMPEMLVQFGLDEALRRYCQNISNENALVVQYDSWGDIKRYKGSFELSVYRIVQELLNNIIKHSHANHALVQLSCQNHILSATIEDNGIGFNQQDLKGDGLGLSSLERRVQSINGKLEVEAEAGSGVSAYLEFETSGLEVANYEYS